MPTKPTPPQSAFELYSANDRESGEVRAQLLQQTLRLTPALMGANVVCGSIIAATFGAAAGWTLWLWSGTLLIVSALGIFGWYRSRGRQVQRVSPRAFKRATRHAAVLGALWGLLPTWSFVAATGPQQVLVSCLLTGMIGAGAFSLAVMPMASIAFVSTITVGALVALWLTGQAVHIPVALLLLCYSAVVIFGALSAARQSANLLRARLTQARQARVQSLLLRDFEAQASEALWETGDDGRLLQVSPRLAEVLGPSAEQLLSVPLESWLERHAQLPDAVLAALRSGQAFHDLRVQLGQGEQAHWCALSATPKALDDDGELGWRGVLADVTDTVRAETLLRRQAYEDDLTGLANRLKMCEAVSQALQTSAPGVLMSIDLDHFKAVNDTLGHSAGDEVLRIVAQRMRRAVRPLDLVARLGGDEFAVLLPAISVADVQAMATRIIEVVSTPMRVGARQVHVGASVGLAALHDDVTSVEALMVNADLALYDAKRAGRGRVASYTTQLGESSRRGHVLEQAIREGLQAGQFELHFQPKMGLSPWQLVGVEALMRWQHPTLGAVPPTEFIPAAERCGLMHQLGDWALRQACLAALQLPGVAVAVNVSALQLMEKHFVERVAEVLAQTGLAAQRLEIEITESVLIDDAQAALDRLHQLRRLGLRVALDDFGTGYSSLAYLRRFPLDVMKIDRSFVHELTQDSDARAIVNMIVQLANQLGMKSVAEGVETPEQLALLNASGCDEAQGFLIARPMSMAALKTWVASGQPQPACAVLH
jgi:diguanylate cyclase (GGDEF)-like protein/PAS domain S-box-containing protein